MGKGLAKQFKQRYPDMYVQYRVLCKSGQLHIGDLWLYKASDKWILNFPTKQHWGERSKPEYIEAGLQKFADIYAQEGITSIAFPALGAGHGGLDFASQVRPLMEQYLAPLPIDVTVYLPKGD